MLNRQTLQALFDAIPTAISVADPQTRRLVTVNHAFAHLVGRPANEIVGLTPPFPWWDADEDLETAFVAGNRFDRVYRRPDGRPQPVEVLRARRFQATTASPRCCSP